MDSDKIRLQPLFKMDTQDIFGYEALYSKGEAEKSYPSALSVLRHIAFMNSDNNFFDFKYFINMTNEDAVNPLFVKQFLSLVDRIDLDRSRIVLELNEATNPDLLRQVKENLGIICSNGIKVALDDFGSCFPTLEFMSDLPLDVVKIDLKIVQNAPNSERDRALLQLCAEVSHDIGCTVVAEGIETQEQLDCAIDAGADIGQGFIFTPNFSFRDSAVNNPFVSLQELNQHLSALSSQSMVA